MTDTVLKYRNKSCRIFREIFFLRASRIHPMHQSGLLKNMFLTARLRNNILKKSSIHKVKSLMNTRYGADVHNQPKIYIENPAENSHISPYICRFTSSLL